MTKRAEKYCELIRFNPFRTFCLFPAIRPPTGSLRSSSALRIQRIPCIVLVPRFSRPDVLTAATKSLRQASRKNVRTPSTPSAQRPNGFEETNYSSFVKSQQVVNLPLTMSMNNRDLFLHVPLSETENPTLFPRIYPRGEAPRSSRCDLVRTAYDRHIYIGHNTRLATGVVLRPVNDRFIAVCRKHWKKGRNR